MRFLRIPAAALLLAAVLSGCSLWGSRPFQDLQESGIVSASVELTPPGVTIEIGAERFGELAGLLREAVVYGEDSSYTDYDGQGVCFTVKTADGAEFTVNAYNPFLIVNGTGYRAEYAPCQALSSFANSLR